jgi:hypothetical protein
MTGMDAQSLLACWEHGRRRHAIDRALLLFAEAEPHADPQTLADRPLGQRNAALLRLRRALFGDAMKSCVACPACTESLEFTLSAASLLGRAPEHAGETEIAGFMAAGRTLRLPTSRDLAVIAEEHDEQSAARRLLERLCAGSPPTEWTDALDVEISRALDEADPCTDLALELVCPACEFAWSAPFDIGAFLWEEVDLRARRLLDEVHALAGSYGWSEQKILALSETRRRAYLDRVLA